jgi:hypothetical protein
MSIRPKADARQGREGKPGTTSSASTNSKGLTLADKLSAEVTTFLRPTLLPGEGRGNITAFGGREARAEVSGTLRPRPSLSASLAHRAARQR